MKRELVAVAATFALIGAGLGVADAQLGRPASPANRLTATTTVPITHAARICPQIGGVTGRSGTSWRAAALGDVETGLPRNTASRSLDATPVGSTRPEITVGADGKSYTGATTQGSGAVALVARGPSAAGLAAVQINRALAGLQRGVSAATCVTPATSFSFLGGSTDVGASSQLLLTNDDDVAASLDLAMYGVHGPVHGVDLEGVVVAPHTRSTLDLVKLAAGQPVLYMTVTVRSGRVAAAMFDRRQSGSLPMGVEWVPEAAGPARHVVVPGVVGGRGVRTMYVANPATVPATINVRLVTPKSAYVPTGMDAISVPPQSVKAVNVGKPLAKLPGAVDLTSDQPVVASVYSEMTDQDTNFADFSWTTGTPPLPGAAVLPFVDVVQRRDSPRSSILDLAAPGAAASVVVRVIPGAQRLPAAALRPRTVAVPAGRSVAIDVGRLVGLTAGDVAVVLEPVSGGGPVYGSLLFTEAARRGEMLAEVPVYGEPDAVVLPGVRADVGAAVPQPGEHVKDTG